MGKYGGYGVTKAGYRRISVAGRLVMEHRLIWEAANGPIPAGYVIHHINEKPLDNRLANLACITQEAHKRIHSGCRLEGGMWLKPCSVCEAFKPVVDEHWYFVQRRGWGRYPTGTICRPCHSARVCARDAAKRASRRTLLQLARTEMAIAAWALRDEGATWKAIAPRVGWSGGYVGFTQMVKRERAAGRV